VLREERLIQRLSESIVNCDVKGAEEAANEILKVGLNPIEVIEKHLIPAVRIVGDKFERGEYFLSHLMMAGDAMDAATKILTTGISEESKEAQMKARGTIVIGTVKGDIHDIGKNLVSLLLRINGLKVYDLGRDVATMEFIKKAEEVKADIIALSALMTVTMQYQAEVINFLKELKLRDKYKVIVGGGPTSQEWAEKIGADGWAPNASATVALVKKLLPVN